MTDNPRPKKPARGTPRRKPSEKTSAQSERKFRSLIDTTGTGYVMLDSQGRVLEANPEYVRLTGHKSLDEIAGRHATEWTAPHHRERTITEVKKCFEKGFVRDLEIDYIDRTGNITPIEINATLFESDEGQNIISIVRDISERRRVKESLNRSLAALTLPLDDTSDIQFSDLFVLEDIQRIQDEFADATGVASLITHPDGTPITQPSNFCRLCGIIRSTEKGRENCFKSDSVIGAYNPDGPIIKTCLSAGLCNAGASISVGGKHIANWLIGQVKNEEHDESQILRYAAEIGVDPEEFRKALEEVPTMSQEQFNKVAKALFSFANELSFKAYQNVQQARFINERVQAEKALRESEERFRIIFNNAADGFVLADIDSKKFHSCNKMFTQMLGYSEEEIKHLAVKDIHPEEDLPYIMEQFNKLVSKETMTTNNIPVKRKDGSILYADIHAMPIRLSGKTYLVGIFRDITERKRAEEALKESESRLRKLSDGIPNGLVYQIDTGEDGLQRKFSYISAGVEQLHGVTVQEALADAMSIYGQVIEEDRVRVAEEEALAVANMEPFRTEVRLRMPSGELKWRLFASAPRRLPTNHLIWDGVEVDITDRKKTEEALQASEEKYRLVVENANDAIMIVQNGMIKFPNRQSILLSGYTEEELMSVPFVNFVHPDDKEMVINTHRRRLQGEEVPSRYTFRIVNKEGEPMWLEASAVFVTWEGRPATLSFLRDITIQKKLEEQLLQSRKMEAIGTLAGGIAHDFNNLLMGILGYTSLMLMKTDKSHPFHEKLKAIERQVESGAELTKQLLGFARGGKYEVRPVNVNELIMKTSDIFGRTKKDITIHRKLQERLHTIEADRGQIEQVLMNLYVNAWQAMSSGGSLYLETQNAIIDEQSGLSHDIRPGAYIKIAVTDTGVGMDAQTLKRIFEPFFTTKGLGKGTGLGLASAYGIIKNHGGVIHVYSEKGHGTTFTIYLPASGKEAIEAEATEGRLLTGDETILIVDDERTNIEAVKELLEILGYRVLTAQSGPEAIEIYRKHLGEIQLVILDMIMPDMNGKETLVKLMDIDRNVRVLLSSGYSINGEAKSILDLGCKGFIQKPFHAEELSQKIRDMLNS